MLDAGNIIAIMVELFECNESQAREILTLAGQGNIMRHSAILGLDDEYVARFLANQNGLKVRPIVEIDEDDRDEIDVEELREAGAEFPEDVTDEELAVALEAETYGDIETLESEGRPPIDHDDM